MTIIPFAKLHGDAISPMKGTDLASGFDLHALDVVTPQFVKTPYNNDFKVIAVKPFQRVLVRTGVSIELIKGLEAQVRPRSGLALKNGIYVHLGTIDADYRGDLGVILWNLSDELFTIRKGDRVAQMVIAPVLHDVELKEKTVLDVTARGAGGFGSTGVRVGELL